MLPTKHSHKSFFRIELPTSTKVPEKIRKGINNINAVWTDIEYLHNLFHLIFSDLNEETNDQKLSMKFSALIVFSMDSHIHLNIIGTLLEKNIYYHLKKQCAEINSVKMKYKSLWKEISEKRHLYIIHREKVDFYKTHRSIASTDPNNLFKYAAVIEDKNGKIKTIEFIPLKDLDTAHECLKEIQEALNLFFESK